MTTKVSANSYLNKVLESLEDETFAGMFMSNLASCLSLHTFHSLIYVLMALSKEKLFCAFPASKCCLEEIELSVAKLFYLVHQKLELIIFA